MIRILFLCHGNICRSPMAEFVMKDLVRRAGLTDVIYVESAAVSSEEVRRGVGNPVYPPAEAELARHGLTGAGKRARQTTREDYGRFDRILCMEGRNCRGAERIYGGDPEGKIELLSAYSDDPREIGDPWYSGDFAGVYEQIEAGCRGLLRALDGPAGAPYNKTQTRPEGPSGRKGGRQ